jgi:excisionase family DNA binding protein
LDRTGAQLSLQLAESAQAGAKRPATWKAAKRELPRLSVKPDEAAAMLGVSRDYLDEHIKPELRIIRRGSKTILIPVAELHRWLEKSAAQWSD